MGSRFRVGKTIMLIGSPVCQALNRAGIRGQEKITETMMEAIRKMARVHNQAHWAMYQDQLRKGLHFLHEYSTDAGSWESSPASCPACANAGSTRGGKGSCWLAAALQAVWATKPVRVLGEAICNATGAQNMRTWLDRFRHEAPPVRRKMRLQDVKSRTTASITERERKQNVWK